MDSSELAICSECRGTLCGASRLLHISTDFKAPTGNGNKSARHVLCKQCTRETHGILGKGQRHEFPDCICSEITQQFPNEDGSYLVGFKFS